MSQFLEFVRQPEVLQIIFFVSLGLSVVSLILIPIVILLIPINYFEAINENQTWMSSFPTPIRVLVKLAKNIFGVFLLGAGILMLALPGQGLLTIFISVLFLDLPYKRKILHNLMARQTVYKSMNKIREIFGKQAILPPKNKNFQQEK